ncbi:hypothetical protein HOLleu_33129 [Holothuria leucospilota]|uniref:Uncharacterized protein n=1 Tax=Holothuria leucospilota TaxID=206669 RepID=A0A9Q0YS87_HOLLE|nr:hypothetical protein HOLleu_33129 [Holothuria leucospilota]
MVGQCVRVEYSVFYGEFVYHAPFLVHYNNALITKNQKVITHFPYIMWSMEWGISLQINSGCSPRCHQDWKGGIFHFLVINLNIQKVFSNAFWPEFCVKFPITSMFKNLYHSFPFDIDHFR